jgi:glycosyltransferase involved in cell wall biosynthesis
MKESFVSVWVDPTSGFGTFPLESMKMGIPVIGLTPNLVPEWMNEDNGIWINNVNMLPDVIADVIQNWLEDNLNPELYNEMEKTITKYTDVTNFNNEVIRIFSEMINNRLKNFEDQLSKFITTE